MHHDHRNADYPVNGSVRAVVRWVLLLIVAAAVCAATYYLMVRTERGQIIERHCKKVLGAQIEGAHNYLSHLTTLSQGHWREILQLLQRNLLDQNTAEQAISGANSAFSLLEILATKK